MSENVPDVAGGDLRVGFGPRMVAAAWFAGTALIPITCFLVTLGRGMFFQSFYEDGGAGLSFYVLLPTSMAAFFGFTIGSRILDKRRVTNEYAASLLGGLVAVASYVGMMCGVVVVQISRDGLGGASAATFLAWALAFALVGAIFLGWLIVIAGLFGGWMLFRWASSRGYPPEGSMVSQHDAWGLNVLAVVVLLVAVGLCSVLWSGKAAEERARRGLSSTVSKGLMHA